MLLSAGVANGSAYCVNTPNNIKTGGCCTGGCGFLTIGGSAFCSDSAQSRKYRIYFYRSYVQVFLVCFMRVSVPGCKPIHKRHHLVWMDFSTHVQSITSKKPTQRTSISGTWSVFMPVLRSTQGTVNWSIHVNVSSSMLQGLTQGISNAEELAHAFDVS